MRLTKHVHACVEIDSDDDHLLIDPGNYSPDAAELVARTSVVLVTHEHADHVDVDVLGAALASRPDLTVYGPAAVVDRWAGLAGRTVAVEPGDGFRVGALDVTVHGGVHAEVHRDLPRADNVGYLVGGRGLHPGDACDVPAVPVDVLLTPVSGPWIKLGEVVDYVRAVAPRRAIAIHEGAASARGLGMVVARFGPGRLVDVPLEVLEPGEAVEL